MEEVVTNLQKMSTLIEKGLSKTASKKPVQALEAQLHEAAETLLSSLFTSVISHQTSSKSSKKPAKIRVKNMSMQAIWGQINIHTESANKALLKKLQRLTAGGEVKLHLSQKEQKAEKDEEVEEGEEQAEDEEGEMQEEEFDEKEMNAYLDEMEKEEESDEGKFDEEEEDLVDDIGEKGFDEQDDEASEKDANEMVNYNDFYKSDKKADSGDDSEVEDGIFNAMRSYKDKQQE